MILSFFKIYIMSFNAEQTIKQFTDLLKTEANTETVIGKAFQLGEFTCVPVIKFGMGLGYGGGEGQGDSPGKGKGEGTGGGAAGGMGVEPIGFLATRGGEISFITTRSPKPLNTAFEQLPGLVEKFMKKPANSKPEEVTGT
jgi:uncharacterized spore protein YtfJ